MNKIKNKSKKVSKPGERERERGRGEREEERGRGGEAGE